MVMRLEDVGGPGLLPEFPSLLKTQGLLGQYSQSRRQAGGELLVPGGEEDQLRLMLKLR